MAALLTLILLAAVIAVVATPLLRANRGAGQPPQLTERAELQAAREAKYREIRDAELDYRTGKLSPEDYEAVDAALRGEAIEILDALQALEAGAGSSLGAQGGGADRGLS
ncbi:MAG TPA: hypothetical protein VHU13_06315 [Solirubrobacteraceae bacterium]|jgi:hypothetical protein|nr:hypothetical protein [Solirubrobacteraceae bacterium]